MPRSISLCAALLLAGCSMSAATLTATETAATDAVTVLGTIDPNAVAQGVLFCEVAGATVPEFAAVTNYSVVNQSAAAVAKACQVWNAGAVPVPPPAVSSVTAVALPQ
jgi:hypothetical protein